MKLMKPIFLVCIFTLLCSCVMQTMQVSSDALSIPIAGNTLPKEKAVQLCL